MPASILERTRSPFGSHGANADQVFTPNEKDGVPSVQLKMAGEVLDFITDLARIKGFNMDYYYTAQGVQLQLKQFGPLRK